MNIIQSILTNNPCYKAGRKITVKGLMLHSVGSAQPSAQKWVDAWNKASYDRACVHAFIDANTGDVYQCLPWNHRGWHSGKGTKGYGHDTHIGVEMCEPDCITYKPNSATFTCLEKDKPRAKAMAQRTYDTAVQLFAHLCKQYNLNPLADGVIVSHKEGHKRGIASNHADPEHLWTGLGMGYTMDTFRNAVNAALNNNGKDDKIMYYVQVPFEKKEDAETIKNAFKVMGVNCTIVTDDNAAVSKPEPKPEPKPEATFAVGDTVKMTSGAPVYGKSTKFSSWVYNATLYVREISGDRVVVSTLKTGAVTGVVDKKYLTKA